MVNPIQSSIMNERICGIRIREIICIITNLRRGRCDLLRTKGSWMKPFLLCADYASGVHLFLSLLIFNVSVVRETLSHCKKRPLIWFLLASFCLNFLLN